MKNLFLLFITITLISCQGQEKRLPDNFDFGTTENGVYQNDYFNMEIPFNPDWAVQDKQEMNDLLEAGEKIVAGDDAIMQAAYKASQVNTAYLLTVFKYDVGTLVDFNPSFSLVAENTKNAPHIKEGSDYLAEAKTLMGQTQMPYYFDKEVFTRKIGAVTFHVLEAKLDYLGLTITQEYISTVINGFSLSFIASYTSEEERLELYEVLDNIRM